MLWATKDNGINRYRCCRSSNPGNNCCVLTYRREQGVAKLESTDLAPKYHKIGEGIVFGPEDMSIIQNGSFFCHLIIVEI